MIAPTPFRAHALPCPGRRNRQEMPGPAVAEEPPPRGVPADDQAVAVPVRPESSASPEPRRAVHDRRGSGPGDRNARQNGTGACCERRHIESPDPSQPDLDLAGSHSTKAAAGEHRQGRRAEQPADQHQRNAARQSADVASEAAINRSSVINSHNQDAQRIVFDASHNAPVANTISPEGKPAGCPERHPDTAWILQRAQTLAKKHGDAAAYRFVELAQILQCAFVELNPPGQALVPLPPAYRSAIGRPDCPSGAVRQSEDPPTR